MHYCVIAIRRYCFSALRHYAGKSNLRLIVSIESLTVFLDGFGQMFAVNSMTDDSCLGISILDDDFKFRFHDLRLYCIIVLLRYCLGAVPHYCNII